MKHRDDLFLVATLVVLFGPFILHGGFLRDDIGLLAYPPRDTTYRHYQWLMSSQATATARPVSACLLGICGWTFGTTPWPYHLVNLTLFGATTMLVFRSLARILPRRVALMTACSAIVYPCAGGTVFSSTMMNANLAGCLWAGALLVSTNPRLSLRADIATAALLALSALSYEAFVPLFLATAVVRHRVAGHDRSWRGLVGPMVPILAALVVYGLYQVAIEPVLFGAAYTRISVPSRAEFARRVVGAVLGGTKVTSIDSLRITLKSLPAIAALPIASRLLSLVWAVVIAVMTFKVVAPLPPRAIPGSTGDQGGPPVPENGLAPADAWMPAIACLLYLLAHLIFVFSSYSPQSWGFENRTQVGVRFAFAFLVSTGLERILTLRRRPPVPWLAATVALLSGSFFLSMVAQREAWIAGARFNDRSLERIERSIRTHGLDRLPSITILTSLPQSFPGEVNHEPIFGVSWDIGGALALAFPRIDIRANVPIPARTVVDEAGVTIDRSWVATFPFFAYAADDASIRTISSSDDWRRWSADHAAP